MRRPRAPEQIRGSEAFTIHTDLANSGTADFHGDIGIWAYTIDGRTTLGEVTVAGWRADGKGTRVVMFYISIESITSPFDIDESALCCYVDRYHSNQRVDDYKLTKPQRRVLVEELRQKSCRTPTEAVTVVKERFGLSYIPAGVGPLIKRVDFIHEKT